MAEPFELVRTVRQHIRRSAQLLDAGNADEALVAIDAALALDPQSVAAQALRERIVTAKPAPARPATNRSDADRSSFVPQGVNAASWRGFEQRITERRFKALIETVNTSISAGDATAARAALVEARELRPDAPGLTDFDRRIAAMPVAFASSAAPASRIWMRATGAAALFLVGVSLLLGLEWMRPSGGAANVPAAPAIAPEVPASAPASDASPATVPNLGSVPVALNDDEASVAPDESVAAIVTPPEPLIRPAATSGTEAEAVPPEQPPLRTAPARSIATRVSPPVVPRSVPVASQSPEETRPLPSTEVSDSYIAPRTATVIPDAGPAVERSEPQVDTPVTADARNVSAPAATVASAVTIPPTVDQQVRVQEVLRQYARAYGQLDASAARAVWSTVDERALARAFQNLSSQQVSFDQCDIDIRGVVANASCRGQLSYAPKVGNRERRTEQRTWRFELRRQGDSWTIVSHDVRAGAD